MQIKKSTFIAYVILGAVIVINVGIFAYSKFFA